MPQRKKIKRFSWRRASLSSAISDCFAMIWATRLRNSSQASQQLIHSGFCLRFMWLHPHGELGIAQVGCHGCKTNLREMKKDLPWSAAQQAAYLCVVWTKRRKTSQRWMKTCSPGRLADRPAAGRGGEEKKAENSKAVNSIFIVFFLHFLVAQQTFFLLWNYLTGSSQVCLRIKMLWKNCLQKCNEPFLQDEFCFDALLTINSSRARFHCLKPPIVFFSPHKRCPWRFF